MCRWNVISVVIHTARIPHAGWAWLVPVIVAITTSGAGASEIEFSRRVAVMGTVLETTVSARDRGTALAASQSILDAVDGVERRLSTWREDSELSRFNRSVSGIEVGLSPELEADLREVRRWWSATGGAFDPGVASLVEAWDLRGRGRKPSDSELTVAREAAGLEHLVLGSGAGFRTTANFGIEEGGFGKGVALREAAAAAMAAGASCVVMNFGGQVHVVGGCEDQRVEIADPRRRNRGVARLSLNSGSAATSGNSERGMVVDGVEFGHLLDPLSGRPVPSWGAVTVVASDPVTADCLATALYVMGPHRGAEWLRAYPGIEAVFAEGGGATAKLTATAGLRGRLVASEGTVAYLDREIANTTK
jgi:thiamine biosynthesis lipoprotein